MTDGDSAVWMIAWLVVLPVAVGLLITLLTRLGRRGDSDRAPQPTSSDDAQ